MFDVVDVSAWVVMAEEPGGAEPKEWLARAEHSRDGTNRNFWLFKPQKPVKKLLAGEKVAVGLRHDHLSERAAVELARLIGVPTATVELADRDGTRGVISRWLAPDEWEIDGGDTTMSDVDGYVSCSGDRPPKERTGHNLANIGRVLDGLNGPPGPCNDWPAFDVFAGYLLFDAWIANTDRHANNWAILRRAGDRRLAPSFDHGSALAHGSSDSALASADVEAFARGGRATRFEGGSSITLCELAKQAAHISDRAHSWLDALAATDQAAIRDVLTEIPGLSDPRRRFWMKLLEENKRRLLT